MVLERTSSQTVPLSVELTIQPSQGFGDIRVVYPWTGVDHSNTYEVRRIQIVDKTPNSSSNSSTWQKVIVRDISFCARLAIFIPHEPNLLLRQLQRLEIVPVPPCPHRRVVNRSVLGDECPLCDRLAHGICAYPVSVEQAQRRPRAL